jgi:hypothetical protein
VKKWFTTGGISSHLFYHDGGWWVDLFNDVKPSSAVALSREVFTTLCHIKDSVPDGEFAHNLGDNIYLKRSLFRSKWYTSVRMYYTSDNGSMQPGRQGVTVNDTAWGCLKTTIDNIGKH